MDTVVIVHSILVGLLAGWASVSQRRMTAHYEQIHALRERVRQLEFQAHMKRRGAYLDSVAGAAVYDRGDSE